MVPQGTDAPTIDENLHLEEQSLSTAQMQTMLSASMTAEAKWDGWYEDGEEDFEDFAAEGWVVEWEFEDGFEMEDPDFVSGGPMAQEDWPDGEMPSDYDAQCYMERYKDLGHILGGWDIQKAKMHWLEHGRFEGRTMTPCGLGNKNVMDKEQF